MALRDDRRVRRALDPGGSSNHPNVQFIKVLCPIVHPLKVLYPLRLNYPSTAYSILFPGEHLVVLNRSLWA
ncbi:MAG: hypothetical protein ACKOYP_07935 [Bacteroidota bacterium]